MRARRNRTVRAKRNTSRPLTFAINGLRLQLDCLTLSLQRLEAGKAHWFTPAREGRPLWSLLVVDAGGRRATLTGGEAATARAELHEGTLSLRWECVRDPKTGAGPFAVEVVIQPVAEKPRATAWRIRVGNQANDWTLWQVEFPRLDGLLPSSTPARDRFYWSDCWGVEYTGVENMPRLQRRYPRGWETTMQFCGYARGTEILYFGVHDPRLTTKEFVFDPPARSEAGRQPGGLAVTTFPENMTRPGNGLVQDYDTVVAVLDGNWFDAAMFYGAWARRQSWATQPPQPLRAMKRSAREVDAWLVMQVPDKPLETWAALTEKLAKHLGGRLGVHFYNWHQIPFDTSYPDYFPERPGFRELAARLNQAGIVTMPYINARLWDINAPSWPARGAEHHACKLSAQRLSPTTVFPPLEEYGSGQKLAPMCPATPFWRDTVVELCRRITKELGCQAIYLDQIAAEKAELCFDPEHGHPLGGGGYWLEGYRLMARQIREAIGPEPMLTTECNWEGCIADFDALLSWHRFSDHLVPMFPVVYAGRARMFGCQFSASDLEMAGGERFARRMALLLVWGGQLGWGDLTPLLEKRHRSLADYFARLCRLRAAYHDTFARGRMLRPPAVKVDEIYASVWQPPEGASPVLFLVNPTRRPVHTTLRIDRTPGSGRFQVPGRRPALRLVRQSRAGAIYRTDVPALGALVAALQEPD